MKIYTGIRGPKTEDVFVVVFLWTATEAIEHRAVYVSGKDNLRDHMLSNDGTKLAPFRETDGLVEGADLRLSTR